MRKAVRFQAPDGSIRLGRLTDDGVIDAGAAPPSGFLATDEHWELIAAAAGTDYAAADVRLLAPTVPGSVLCIGSNYRDHIEESGLHVPEHPIVFAKMRNAIIGPEDAIVVPLDEPQTDWEVELALVIGRTTRRVAGAEALAAIGGVTVMNDVSGRYAQLSTGLGQYVRGKSYDTFGPIGPAVVQPADLDIHDLGIRLRLNGTTMQDSSTRYLLFTPEYLVEWLSAGITLQPGDVIATGTPGGVGHALTPPRYLQSGDVVEAEIDHIGVLRNPVAGEQP